MKNLRNRINHYSHLIRSPKLSRADMHDESALMTVYENIWETLSECGDLLTFCKYESLLTLYGDLGDYIAELHNPIYRWQSATMGNLVQTFGEVIAQAWDSLVNYRVLDLKWHYKKGGF